MRRYRASLAVAGFFVAAITSGPLRAEGGLSARLDAALAAPALRGARIGVLVVGRDDGAVRYARSPDHLLVPASNLKVLTALAALRALGPAHRFTTRIHADRVPDAHGAVGSLYVVGGGDPTLTSEQCWRLAADLRLAGLRAVEGDLVLDDSVFDRIRWHPAWGEISSRAYHAPVGALSANYGAFAVTVLSGEAAGEPVRVRVDPPVGYLRVVNRARTVATDAPDTLSVGRVAAGALEEVRVSGSRAVGAAPRTFYRSVLDPALYAGAVLRMQLEANGIHVAGQTRLERLPDGSPELLRFEGRPLAEVVRLFVKYSNNSVAESLVKVLAHERRGEPGSWSTGLPVLREELLALGLDPAGLSLVDGSGLSHTNRVTPRTLVRALHIAGRNFGLGAEFVSALPIAARDGTLERRSEGASGRVRAKTGLLDRVTALSGYAETEAGENLIFSILVNGYRSSDEEAMAAVDGFVAALVRPDAAQ